MKLEEFMSKKVKDLMEAPVKVAEDMEIQKLQLQLMGSPSEIVGVTSKDNKLEGIVTKTTLIQGLETILLQRNKTAAKDIMLKDAETISEDATVSEALKLMDSRGYDKLPVVDGQGKFVGVISRRAILRRAATDLTLAI